MVPDDNKELFVDFNNKKKGISELKSTLNTLNETKEKFFTEKNNISNEIKKLISEIKTIKTKRDDLTKNVKSIKEEKEKIIKEIKEKIEIIKPLMKEKKEISQKHDLKDDPIKIKKQIEKLETIFETEVMSFDKEQKTMKIIKNLKSKLNEYGDTKTIYSQINVISKEIDVLKAKEKELKKEIKTNAKNSQIEHEKILEISKKIDELKVKEKESYNEFLKYKQEFTEKNKELKELLSGINEVKDSIDKKNKNSKKNKEIKDKRTIQEKKKDVDEKIKKGHKLTTEDLLIFQRDE